MARYIPTDDMGQIIAREFVLAHLRTELERGRVTVSVSEMREDGTYQVSLLAAQVEFDFATMLDNSIAGTAWIEESARPSVQYEFPGELQPYTFLTEHGI